MVHGFVTFHVHQRTTLYTIDYKKIIALLRYPRYIFLVRTCCGNESQIMLEEILKHGYIKASDLIIKTYRRIQESPSSEEPSIPNLKDTFELLVKNQFLMRSLSFDTMLEDVTKPDYNLPSLNLKAISNLLQDKEGDPGDRQIYWKVNIDRFTQDLRDQILVSAVTRRFEDKNAGELMRQLINLMYLRTASWEDTSNPIPYTEIKDAVKKLNYPELEQYLEQYLHLIEEDSSHFIVRTGDSGGGQYRINMKNAFNQLAWTTLENIITEKFNSQTARIFRLIRHKISVELEQVLQYAMMPVKQVKQLTYILALENYIQIQELKKSGVSAGPLKTFYLYYINLNQVVQMHIEQCYHALHNMIQRREHESISNKRMIDKQLRVEIVSSNMKEQGATEEQLADIEEMMTPSEKQQLKKIEKSIKKLSAAELLVDETLFLLHMYQLYHH
ncbi:DNA-directed RNA polymerase III subunit RPC3 isoform X2 [Odontomachus brunneus]|nr:DNA-directed RNA polymerase III subunit RPC3 isoform X2 [Odontomachus brunneus]